MKYFKKQVLTHIKSSLPPTLDQQPFAYGAKRSDDVINTALNNVLTHLQYQGKYVRMLFVNFSSTFNTIILSRIGTKLLNLGVTVSVSRHATF